MLILIALFLQIFSFTSFAYASLEGERADAVAANESLAVPNAPVTTIVTHGNVTVFAFSTHQGMADFQEELKPITQILLAVGGDIDGLEDTIMTNINSRFALAARAFHLPGDVQEYDALVMACIKLESVKAITINGLQTIAERLRAIKSEQLARITRPYLLAAVANPGQRMVNDREQRLLASGRRSHVTRRDGTQFVEVLGTYVPVTRNAQPQELHDQMLAKSKCDFLDGLLASIETVQRNHTNFADWIEAREDALTYNLHRLFNPDEKAMAEIAMRLVFYYPAGSDKEQWTRLRNQHLGRVKAATQAATQTPESLAAEAAVAIQMQARDAAARDQATAEKRARDAQIRLLRTRFSAAATAESETQAETETFATRQTLSTIIPSAVIDLVDHSSLSISKAEQAKYDAAIAAIKTGEKPSDFRGTMEKESLGIECFNVLHCGISDAMRIYYILHGGKAHILDVSNHDMHSLGVAVQRFKASL